MKKQAKTMKLQVKKSIISLSVLSAMAVTSVPVVSQPVSAAETAQELLKAGSIPASDETMTLAQPFSVGTGGSYSFRIPALVSLENGEYSGNLVAAVDARYTTPGDGGGLDTIASVSEDMGQTWNYSFPIWFPDSEGYASKNATTVIDPVLVEGPDGTIYCMADVNPTGITTHYGGIPEGTGYIEVGGEKRLALTSDYTKAGTNPTSNTSDYAYYVGDFENGYAPVLSRSDGSATDWRVDEWYNIEKKKNGVFEPLVQKRVNTDETIQQNVFYKASELHVFNIGYIWIVESKDGGKSWGNPRIVNDQIKPESGESYILVCPGKGLTTSEGIITVPLYGYQGGEKASFMYSVDGVNWIRTNNVDHLPSAGKSSESEMVELSDGTLRMFSRTAKNALNHICYTDVIEDETGNYAMGTMVDTGISAWSDCKVSAIRYSKQVNGKDLILVSCPSGSGARTDGRIYSFLVNEDKTMELLDTFDIKDPEDSDNTAFAYSCIVEQKDGTIGLLWEATISGYIGENPYRILYTTYKIEDGILSEISEDDDVKHIVLEQGGSYTIDGETASVTDGNSDAVRIEEFSNYFLCNHTSNTNDTNSAFSQDINHDAVLDNAMMTFMDAGDGKWHIKNEFTNHYLTNTENTSQAYYFNPIAENMTVETVSVDQDMAFRIKNEAGSYICYSYTNSIFDRSNNSDTSETQTCAFILWEKKDTVSDEDVIPGYQKASEIVSGGNYLITCVRNDYVIVLYPYTEDVASWTNAATVGNSCKPNRTKLFRNLPVTQWEITGLMAGETVDVEADGTTYRIEVKEAVSKESLTVYFESVRKEAESVTDSDKGNYSSASWSELMDVYQDIKDAEEGLSVTAIKALTQRLETAKENLVLIDREAESQKAAESLAKAEAYNTTDGSAYQNQTEWLAFKKAYDALKEIENFDEVDVEELQRLYQDLDKAREDFENTYSVVKPEPDDKTEETPDGTNQGTQNGTNQGTQNGTNQGTTPKVEEGGTYDSGNYSYKVTSLSKQTVAVTGTKNKSLKKLEISNTVTLSDNKTYKVTSIEASAFKGNKKVTAVTVPTNVETIGNNAFSGCTKLTTVTVKSTKLKTIGSKAFYNCKKLKNITLKTKKLSKIGNNAFKGIHKKAAVKVPAGKYKAYKKRFSNISFKK